MAVKVQLQLSVDLDLKERLEHIRRQTGIPISRVIADILEEHLSDFEKRHRVQPTLPLSRRERRHG